MAEVNRLTAAQVANLKARGEKSLYVHDGAGLYLQVKPTGGKSWLLRFQLAKREREMGLGSYPTISLAAARERAYQAKRLLQEGKDPIEERRATLMRERQAANARATFTACTEQFLNAKRAEWGSKKHAEQWTNTLKDHAEPVLGKMYCDEITTEDVARVLRPLWGTITETAKRLRGRIEAVLDFAKTSKYRTGENPAIWKGNLENLLADPAKAQRVTHHPALPYKLIGDFMRDLRMQPGDGARCLELTILTAARTQESRLAKREEFDAEANLWTVPASRMKMKEEHVVPLCPRVLEIVRAQPLGEYLFTNPRDGKPLSTAGMDSVLSRMKKKGLIPEGVAATVHGFRACFKTWATEETNYDNIISEMALAHAVPPEVEGAYRRGTLAARRAKLMQEWADYCDKPSAAVVVPLREAA